MLPDVNRFKLIPLEFEDEFVDDFADLRRQGE
jgi:hypothetical protein